jgi:hypothetical protein
MASLIPKATAWVTAQSDLIARSGLPLNDEQTAIARSVGVAHPEKIRILEVNTLPIPGDTDLMLAAQASGLLSPNIDGLTLGHGIYIRHGQASNRLLSHEFRHVYQYEQAGSIAAFLSVYLQQILTVGYQLAPLEIDAREHEIL